MVDDDIGNPSPATVLHASALKLFNFLVSFSLMFVGAFVCHKVSSRGVCFAFKVFLVSCFLGCSLTRALSPLFFERDEIERKFSLHKEGPPAKWKARVSLVLSRALFFRSSQKKKRTFFVFCARGFACFKCCCARELTRSSSSSSSSF